MALFQSKEDKSHRAPERVEEPKSVAPAISIASPSYPEATPTRSDFQATLGQGSRVEGRLSFEGSVRIDGVVDGEINAQDTVHIGESAVVTAQVQAGTIIILGQLKGDVKATRRVELRSPGKLVGNIHTPTLVIHEGVTFEGHCTMGATEAKGKVTVLPVGINSETGS